jgi:hypothetical protein
MSLHIFRIFTKMIAVLPVEAVIKALDLECKMLEDDFEHQRLTSSEDATSIFSFRRFVHMARLGQAMQSVRPVPPDHLEFYKETIVRLVQANELPPSTMEQRTGQGHRPGFVHDAGHCQKPRRFHPMLQRGGPRQHFHDLSLVLPAGAGLRPSPHGVCAAICAGPGLFS